MFAPVTDMRELREWSAFLDPAVLDCDATERWIAAQQAPVAWSHLNLDSILHATLRLAWHAFLNELRSGIVCEQTETGRLVQITRYFQFIASAMPLRLDASFTKPGRAPLWFGFDVFEPLPGGFWTQRVLRAQASLPQVLDEALAERGFEPGRCEHLFSPVRNQIGGLLWGQIGQAVRDRIMALFDSEGFNAYLLVCLQVPPDYLLRALVQRKSLIATQRFTTSDFNTADLNAELPWVLSDAPGKDHRI
ncbi:hypothetical protein C7S18_12760 [Ahniella affigens]|uniref:Uncharacterized protein n=1 Tax=Ahniella affigens TaxID=2021234 RepID=A0A2P1PT49_9GAMM|nr:hypothetical protein [Ahniella affigens]AVP98019.1 hypothetical protein C7S18_12760 [Ahniella affigens]